MIPVYDLLVISGIVLQYQYNCSVTQSPDGSGPVRFRLADSSK
jgi:hypothetical protein